MPEVMGRIEIAVKARKTVSCREVNMRRNNRTSNCS